MTVFKRKQVNLFLGDIRFWIILFFIIRLFGITNPPLESSHNWRQTDVTMVARNFLETDNNILYPRIDIAGDKTGITGMEFPLLNYLIYLVSLTFGYEHWYGRIINLMFSSFGLFYFFKLIKKYFTKKVAFNASLILMSSIWFSFSRKIMPDTFSMSFIVASIYYGSTYFDSEKSQFKNLIIYFILLSIGVLTKLPSGYLMGIFAVFIFNQKYNIKKKVIFIIVSIISLTLPLIWYFYWVPHLVSTYGFWHFGMGKPLTEGFQELANNIPLTFKRFYSDGLKYIGFTAFLFGVIFIIIKRNKLLIYILSLSSFLFIIIMLKSGIIFLENNYYTIPFVPVMSLVAGYGISCINNKKIALFFLLAICIEGVSNQQHDFWISDKKLVLLALEMDMDRFSRRDDLILINSNSSPTPMYFSHRKGWSSNEKEMKDTNYINHLKSKGLKYIVAINFSEKLPYKIVTSKETYTIYKL